MHSPFHAVMTTAVLDVRELAQLMHRYAGRASRGAAAGCRDEEEDAVLLGKLLLLDDLAWRVWSEEMSATEMAELRAAANELGRAVEILTGRVAAAAKGVERDGEDGWDDESGECPQRPDARPADSVHSLHSVPQVEMKGPDR